MQRVWFVIEPMATALGVTPSVVLVLLGLLIALLVAAVARLAQALRGKGQAGEGLRSLGTWCVMMTALAGAILAGRLGVVAFFCGLSVLAMREFLKLVPVRVDRATAAIAYVTVVVHYAVLFVGREGWEGAVWWSVVGAALVLPLPSLWRGEMAGFRDRVGEPVWGLVLTTLCLGHAVMLLDLHPGVNVDGNDAGWPGGAVGPVLFVVLVTELNDIAQALWGRALGVRHPVPRVSPGKTWAGLIGGVSTTVVLGMALGPLLTPLGMWGGAGAALVIGVGGFVGDLAMSGVKRDAGVKDSGSILPGMGGVLDRIDSLIFTAPLFYGVMWWAGT